MKRSQKRFANVSHYLCDKYLAICIEFPISDRISDNRRVSSKLMKFQYTLYITLFYDERWNDISWADVPPT